MGDMTVSRRLWAILFPERCVCCGKVIVPGADLCPACRAEMPRIGVPVCPFCGLEKEWCTCRKRRRHYERVVAPFYYVGVAEEAVRHMKHTADRQAVCFFAAETAETVRQYYGDVAFDAVVFVPTTRHSDKARGFNPGRLVAAETAKCLGLPLWEALVKITENAPQKSLSAEERTGNVLGVYDPAGKVDLQGKTLLLVDDVVTTGATLDECAKMLKIAGAEAVFAAVGAAARKEKEQVAFCPAMG